MDYTEVVRDSIAYINAHWDEDLSVADVAASVHMSPFHFHRVFSAVTGLPVMRFVRLKRLQHAAQSLRSSTRSIADIALECGFESQATFTRAFVKQLGIPPGAFRKASHGNEGLFLPNLMVPISKEDISMAKVINSPEFEFVGLMLENLDTTNDNGKAIVDLWAEFYRSVLSPDEDVPTFGICFPGNDTTFSYMAAVERKHLEDIPDNTVSKTVIGHEYAVFEHDESTGLISDAFRHIWSTGLPSTGREYFEGAPDLEVYPGRSWGKQVVLEIWIPVC